jgi:hypothetical protein
VPYSEQKISLARPTPTPSASPIAVAVTSASSPSAPRATTTPTLTPSTTPKAIRRTKLLIFGDHIGHEHGIDQVYIVTNTPNYDLGLDDENNQKYISHCCRGPDQSLPLKWAQLPSPPHHYKHGHPPPAPLATPFTVGKYTVQQVRLAILNKNIRIQPATEGLPEVSQEVANKYNDELWWIFDVAY